MFFTIPLLPPLTYTDFPPSVFETQIIKLVPPILVVLASHPAFEQHDLSSLTWLMSGAAPLGEGLVKRVKSRFQTIHKITPRIVQGYGCVVSLALVFIS